MKLDAGAAANPEPYGQRVVKRGFGSENEINHVQVFFQTHPRLQPTSKERVLMHYSYFLRTGDDFLIEHMRFFLKRDKGHPCTISHQPPKEIHQKEEDHCFPREGKEAHFQVSQEGGCKKDLNPHGACPVLYDMDNGLSETSASLLMTAS